MLRTHQHVPQKASANGPATALIRKLGQSRAIIRRPFSQRSAMAPGSPEQYADFVIAAQKAAQAGAKVVMDAVDKPRTISFKGATDLVTDTDKAAEEAILTVLRQEFPDHALLGEEGGVSGNPLSPYLWCVDPLDGTTNFAHGYPAFGVSVGLLERGVPVAGCVVEFTGGVHCWATREFTASRGGGAFCNGRRIRASIQTELTRCLLVTGFGYEHDAPWAANMALFKEFTDVCQGVRRLGAASVDLCHVALGIVEGYWEYRLKPWDVAAGVLIAREAGALVTTMDGLPYSVFERSMMAVAPGVHKPVLQRTKRWTRKIMAEGEDFSPWYIPEGYLDQMMDPQGWGPTPNMALFPELFKPQPQ